MRKIFLFSLLNLAIMLMPSSAQAQSFWKQLGEAITSSQGNTQQKDTPPKVKVYTAQPYTVPSTKVSPKTAQQQQPRQQPQGPLYQIHATSATKVITLQGGAQQLSNFSCGVALVQWKKGWFAINTNGEKIFDLPAGYWPGEKDHPHTEFDNDRLIITATTQSIYYINMAIIDTRGNIIKEFKEIHHATPFSNGVAIIEVDEKRGYTTEWVPYYIDKNGNILSKTLPAYKKTIGGYVVGSSREGMRRFYDDKTGRVGYCDEKCNIVIPAQYKEAGNFFNGLAKAKNNDDLWGYIDKTGRFVINPMFSIEPGAFYNDYAWVKDKAGKNYFIDKTGKFIWQDPANGKPQKIYNFLSGLDNGGYALWVYDRNLYIMDSSFRKRAKLVEVFETNGSVTSYDDSWFQFTDEDYNNFVYDWNGRLLLKFGEDYGTWSTFNNGLCRKCDNGGCYFNLKGEIVVQFKDTQF